MDMPEITPDECARVLAETNEFPGLDLDLVVPEIYADLKQLAERQLQRESREHTLSATALAHEAYLRLAESRPEWASRQHVLAIAARIIRHLLIDQARARAVRRPVTERITTVWVCYAEQQFDLLALEESLQRLANVDEKLHRLVELRFFGGLTLDEVAEVMGLSKSTVKRKWDFAKAWLYRDLGESIAG